MPHNVIPPEWLQWHIPEESRWGEGRLPGRLSGVGRLVVAGGYDALSLLMP